jgi:hypothetical protein
MGLSSSWQVLLLGKILQLGWKEGGSLCIILSCSISCWGCPTEIPDFEWEWWGLCICLGINLSCIDWMKCLRSILFKCKCCHPLWCNLLLLSSSNVSGVALPIWFPPGPLLSVYLKDEKIVLKLPIFLLLTPYLIPLYLLYNRWSKNWRCCVTSADLTVV